MSGKDLEPVTAFFPSIDRNLMADLDRQLRGTHAAEPAPEAAPPVVPVTPPQPEPAAPATPPQTGRVDIAGVLEAVEHAASSMTAMAERIEELEGHSQQLEAANHQLATQLDETTRQRDAMTAALQAEKERAKRLETLAAHHVSRASGLERDLGLARADLAKIVETITHALGAPGEQG